MPAKKWKKQSKNTIGYTNGVTNGVTKVKEKNVKTTTKVQYFTL